jgi:hypothetical protein
MPFIHRHNWTTATEDLSIANNEEGEQNLRLTLKGLPTLYICTMIPRLPSHFGPSAAAEEEGSRQNRRRLAFAFFARRTL